MPSIHVSPVVSLTSNVHAQVRPLPKRSTCDPAGALRRYYSPTRKRTSSNEFHAVEIDTEKGVQSGCAKFEEDLTSRSEFLKLTALCPAGDAPPNSSASCSLQHSDLIEADESTDLTFEAECPSY